MSEKTLAEFYLESDEDAAGVALEGDRRIAALRVKLEEAEGRVAKLERAVISCADPKLLEAFRQLAETAGIEPAPAVKTWVCPGCHAELPICNVCSNCGCPRRGDLYRPIANAAPLVGSAVVEDDAPDVVCVVTGVPNKANPGSKHPRMDLIFCRDEAQAREIASLLSEARMPGKGAG